MEDTSNLPCLAVGTLSIMDPRRKRTASTEPEEIDGNLKWEVEGIVKSEIISYTRKVGSHNKQMRELRYFVKWIGCSEDENTWEPPESLENAHQLIEGFHEENPDMLSRADFE